MDFQSTDDDNQERISNLATIPSSTIAARDHDHQERNNEA
jgi:hypothetical protein